MDFYAYLKHEGLFTQDPYEQAGLLEKTRLAIAPQNPVFVNFYRSPKVKIYCHICGSHRHNNGLTGALGDGSKVLFGSKCAKAFFGTEVTNMCAGDLRSRTKRAYDRFLILDICSSIGPVEDWLSSYKPMIQCIESGWIDIHIRYEKPIEELLTHLRRNNGRLLKTSVISIGGSAQKEQLFEQQAIITYISSPEAIPNLKRITQRLSLVDNFVYAVRSIRREPSAQLFSNLASMFQKTLDAAQEVDACLAFTADFFRTEKLALVSDWIESRRRARLAGKPEMTRQELGPKFVKLIGSGLEKPRVSLAETLKSTEVTSKLAQQKKGPADVGLKRGTF